MAFGSLAPSTNVNSFSIEDCKPDFSYLQQESDIINENDEEIHDEIVHKISKEPRMSSSLPFNLDILPLTSIEEIVENFSCRICMEITKNPYVIKHCLHFFCKDCIDTSIRTL
jgi:hypothetical protein